MWHAGLYLTKRWMKSLSARFELSQSLRFSQWCCWGSESPQMWHYIRWVVPDILKVQSTLISNSWAGQEGCCTCWYLKLKAVWFFEIWDLLTQWQGHISEESYPFEGFFDNLSDTLHRKPSSQMLGLFCLFKAWMQTSYTDVRNTWGIVEFQICRVWLRFVCNVFSVRVCVSSAGSLRGLWLLLAVQLFSVISTQCTGSLSMIAVHKNASPSSHHSWHSVACMEFNHYASFIFAWYDA
jgi:hypothetical protein